jgi:hypothetical protein
MSSYKKYLPWNWPGITWGDNPYIWSEVFILIEKFAGAIAGGGSYKPPKKGPVWRSIEKTLKKKGYNDEEATRFLEVVVELNGLKKKEIREVDDLKKEITNKKQEEPKQKTVEEAAEKWVFETNGHKWSNDDDTAGDNYGSFREGAKWMLEKLQDFDTWKEWKDINFK